MGHTKELFNRSIATVLDQTVLEKVTKELSQEVNDTHPLSILKKVVHSGFHKIGIEALRYRFYKELALENHWIRRRFNLPFYKLVLENSEDLDQIYEWLSDSYSKRVFDWFVQIHIAGLFLGKDAPLFFPQIEKDKTPEQTLPIIQKNGILSDRYRVGGYRIHCRKDIIESTFQLRQYAYKDVVIPSNGEFVIDGGAYYGDTGIWFSNAVGRDGHVWCFEPNAKNQKILRKNISVNRLSNMSPVPKGLWEGEEQLSFFLSEASSRVIKEKSVSSISVTSLDSFVEKEKIPKVDFIKLDIEGAERNALNGMEMTIRQFKPKLAVCVYHRYDDIIVIPQFIKTLHPGYRLFLDHFYDGLTETVMFFLP
jgi:FkbM family methyltransferase